VFSDYDLVLLDKLGIDEVTKEAFSVLGNNSQIIAANHYSCTECSQEYKKLQIHLMIMALHLLLDQVEIYHSRQIY